MDPGGQLLSVLLPNAWVELRQWDRTLVCLLLEQEIHGHGLIEFSV
jgi:hypothetical protein